MEEDEENPAVVIDNGSYKVKAGFSGDDAPRSVFPAVVGTPKCDPAVVGSKYKDTYVGDEACVKRDILTLKCPREHPNDPNWDEMEKIWHHVFYNELRVKPEDFDVLITETPLDAKRNREKMTEIMFEKFNSPNFYLCIDAVLSLYASGRTSGVVFDSGYHSSRSVPIYEGYALAYSIRRTDIAGNSVTEYLATLLQQRGYAFGTTAERRIINYMKERLSYVALDFGAEMETCSVSADSDKVFKLPDGRIISIRNERFRCAEAMFQPSLIGKVTNTSVQKILHDSIIASDLELKRQLFENIVLTGGATMSDGFDDRLTNELKALVSQVQKVKVIAPPERKCSTWIGGSILASLAGQRDGWISKQEYGESGTSIVHRKCF